MLLRHPRLLVVCLLAAALLASSARAQQNCGPLVDTIGGFSISSTYSVGGSGALVVARNQAIGPRLILNQPTLITEIGGLLNSSFPLMVQIRPDLNGVPNPAVITASFLLSFDNDPGVYSYESVKPNLILPAGTYFVLFAPQVDEAAGLLQTHSGLIAGSFPAGSLNLDTGETRFSKEARCYASPSRRRCCWSRSPPLRKPRRR